VHARPFFPHNGRVTGRIPGRALLTCLLFSVGLGCLAARARAEVLEAPVGGRAFPLGEGRVACGNAAGGFVVDPSGRAVKPPPDADAVGEAVELKVARTAAECATSSRAVTLVATGTVPSFDATSIVFWPDDGRLEATGNDLAGVSIAFRSGATAGSDVCRSPETVGGRERCSWGVPRGLSADLAVTTFSFLPRGARADADADSVLFDALGRRLRPEQLRLVPARVHLTRITPPEAAIDLATGQGELPLAHPEVVSAVECSALQCEQSGGKVIVRGTASLVSSIDVRLRFSPHVFLWRKNAAEAQVSVKLPVLHCPMSIVSGPVVRNNDDAKLVVKLEGGCAHDLGAVRFATDDGPLKPLRVVNEQSATYVLLRVGETDDDSLTVSALRGADSPIMLAVAHTPTRAAPIVRSSLELPRFPNLDFIPNNRPAEVHVTPAGEHERYALLPVPGVYEVEERRAEGKPPATFVRGDRHAAGLTSLRFGLRSTQLPGELASANLAVLGDPLQRSVREAHVPAPIETSLTGPAPLIEMLCGRLDQPVRLMPGATEHVPFAQRDTCRVVFHRERLSPEYGTQKLRFEVEVLRADGSARGEGRVTETLTLRAGSEPRVAYVRGVAEPFDRIIVRVSHEPDEAHYMGADELRTGSPNAQWSAILGAGRARLYGTTAIPTGLYRFGDPDYSGLLSLNFGVISRLTWLDEEGHEGFLGAEAGVLVIGLANSQSQTGRSLTQVGVVAGLGVSVPIANRSAATQASINLHAWFEADLTKTENSSSRYAFIFGPSISIGNVGTNL
jgi:hypothetical protein